MSCSSDFSPRKQKTKDLTLGRFWNFSVVTLGVGGSGTGGALEETSTINRVPGTSFSCNWGLNSLSTARLASKGKAGAAHCVPVHCVWLGMKWEEMNEGTEGKTAGGREREGGKACLMTPEVQLPWSQRASRMGDKTHLKPFTS